MFTTFAKALSRQFSDVAMFRSFELHDSNWPHVHVLLRSSAIAQQAISESTRLGHGTNWDTIVAYASTQRERRDAKLTRVARCPFPGLRKALKGMAVARGFGNRFDLCLVDRDTMRDGRMASYICKGPMAFGPGQPMREDGPPTAIVAEVTKSSQRTGRLLVRGTRCFGTRGRFFDAPAAEEFRERLREQRRAPGTIRNLAWINRSISVVRDCHECDEVGVANELHRVDFHAPIPGSGQKRTACLDSMDLGDSLIDKLSRFKPSRDVWYVEGEIALFDHLRALHQESRPITRAPSTSSARVP